MCGIVGYIGPREATPIVLDGLKRLEYRGYDSAGIATLKLCQNGELQRKANELAAYLRAEGNQVFKEKGINGWLYSRSITHVYLGTFDFESPDDSLPPTKDMDKILGMNATTARLGHHLLHRNISTMSGRMFILSCMHTIEDIDKTLAAADEAFKEI